MFSPLNSQDSEEWFQKLNRPLRHLPASERTEAHLEVRQHLEALAAANEELGSSREEAWEFALAQFGDPARIGQKLYQEWRQSKTGLRAGLNAVIFGTSLHLLWGVTTTVAFALWLHFQGTRGPIGEVSGVLAMASLLIINFAIGRKYPHQALKGALYSSAVVYLATFCRFLPLILHPQHLTSAHGMVTVTFMLPFGFFAWFTLVGCTIAYLASVTRRGWYRPSLADFKLNFPRLRQKIAR